jgi:hypothetical protein
MDQRSICLFLKMQRFSASDIHGQFVAILDLYAIACSPVIKCLRRRRCAVDEEMAPKLEGPDVIDRAILAALDEYLFSSVQDLFKRIYISPTMIWRRITNFIDFIVMLLH